MSGLSGKYDIFEDAQFGEHGFMANVVVPVARVAVHVDQRVFVSCV
jgi:hypothetical protein